MKKIFPTFIALFSLSTTTGQCASVIVDSFADGDFHLATGGLSSIDRMVSGPFSDRRIVRIRSRLVPEGISLSSNLSSASESLSFHVDTQGIASPVVLDMRITYTGGGPNGSGPFDLTPFDGFLLRLSDVYGSGSLIVELGTGSEGYGPSVTRTPIAGSGDLFVPFSALTYGFGGSLESMYHMHFTFESESAAFGFSLSEISVVPEPTIALIIPTAILLMMRRRRSYP
jgi:hypothetical protein